MYIWARIVTAEVTIIVIYIIVIVIKSVSRGGLHTRTLLLLFSFHDKICRSLIQTRFPNFSVSVATFAVSKNKYSDHGLPIPYSFASIPV